MTIVTNKVRFKVGDKVSWWSFGKNRREVGTIVYMGYNFFGDMLDLIKVKWEEGNIVSHVNEELTLYTEE